METGGSLDVSACGRHTVSIGAVHIGGIIFSKAVAYGLDDKASQFTFDFDTGQPVLPFKLVARQVGV